MATDRPTPTAEDDNPLGTYLKERRARLDPKAFGFSASRRRTPGLRREEVAQRADVSATWYTWLEQGRGGAPSADVLDRLAEALALTEVEREYLFLLAQHRPPEIRATAAGSVTPRLQRVLDALTFSPAYVKTATWDIVAWNRAAAAVLTDYGTIPVAERNLLRIMFSPRLRDTMPDWEAVVRSSLASFRADVARAGASERVAPLLAELSAKSPEFAAMWRDNEVRTHGEGTKIIHRPGVGTIAMDYSSFAVDGQPDLGMVVYSPATPEDERRVRDLIGY